MFANYLKNELKNCIRQTYRVYTYSKNGRQSVLLPKIMSTKLITATLENTFRLTVLQSIKCNTMYSLREIKS